jgi:hypothetical protein
MCLIDKKVKKNRPEIWHTCCGKIRIMCTVEKVALACAEGAAATIQFRGIYEKTYHVTIAALPR